jgi:CubicO group peptidase (beta-lactamase class C family)
MVEEISKQPFNEYCKTNIITPLGMNNSGWFIKEVDTLKQAKLYVKASRRNKINEWLGKLISKQTGDYFQLCNYSFFNYPDGLLKTSVKELSNFMIAIMDQGAYNGQQILEKATVSRMLTPQLEGNGLQGLGWKKIKSEPLWGHGGSDPGIQTRMYFNPETNVGIILFQNTGRGNTFKLVKNMYSLIVDNEE